MKGVNICARNTSLNGENPMEATLTFSPSFPTLPVGPGIPGFP